MIQIANLSTKENESVTLKGWIQNKRDSKGLIFLVLRDGSGFCQCIVNLDEIGQDTFDTVKQMGQESSISVIGNVVKDERQIGGYEIHATSVELIGSSENYPISNKEHGVEFLMDNRHLWIRSKRPWAILRIRNRVKYAIHTFFQDQGFIQTDSPIFTGNAAEGSTTLFSTDYYGQEAYLAQTGQLYGEATAMAMGRIYTFGPTFRAEKSKTRRHLSEFWMIEPEMAFYDLDMNMDLIESFIQYIVSDIHKNCATELAVLDRDLSLFETIQQPFPRLTYREAVEILRGEKDVNGKNSLETLQADYEEMLEKASEMRQEIEDTEAIISKGGIKKGKLNYLRNKVDSLKSTVKTIEERATNIPNWIKSAKNFKFGEDLGGSDETVITRLFNTPVLVYKWPKDIKAFYMKRYEDDDDFVKGVDCLAPDGFGEIVGGSEREESLDILLERIAHEKLPQEAFEWYLDLRRYGSVPHSGFGLGFERLIMWLTGCSHIRETIPFPRYYGRLFP